MNNVLSNKKKIYIVGINFLGIVLSIALIILILKLSSVRSINSTTDDTASYAVSYTVSYPVSYNNISNNIVEQTEIVPLNAANLTKTINTEEYCGNDNTTNLGIVTYRYSSGDFSTHDENQKAFLINNRNTVKGENEEQDFAEVINVIDNKTEITSLKDLHAFNYSCGGAASTFIKTFDMDFPAVDKSLASIYVGGTQYAWAHLSDVKFTIKILAQKGDNVMLMSEYFEGSELMTEDQVQTCSANSGYDYQYLPMECIRDLYKQSPDAQEKVNKRAQDLIKFFEF